MESPQDYGIDHPEWYTYQHDSLRFLLDIDRQVGLLEAPPGSGKSALAKGISSQFRTFVLTRTKSLQSQYKTGYLAQTVEGRGNYSCIHPQGQGRQCDECLYLDEGGMSKCPHYYTCNYVVDKLRTLGSNFGCLNYAYWLHAQRFREAEFHHLILDECHTVPETVLDHVGIKISEEKRRRWYLPEFPTVNPESPVCNLIQVETKNPIDIALGFLEECASRLNQQILQLQPGAQTSTKIARRLRSCEYFHRDIAETIRGLRSVSSHWFIQSSPISTEDSFPEFVCRPLTARYHFPKWFEKPGRRLVLMSATIGDFETFTEELGLPSGGWISRRVPHRYPVDVRPVWALPVPGMGQSAGLKEFEEQADWIAKFIKSYPSTWGGLLHVTRKKEATYLAHRLARRDLGDRVWVPPEVGTKDMLIAWENRKRKFPNSLCISWAFWEGIDERQGRINVVCKMPYPYLGDPYEKMRQRLSGRMFNQRAAWGAEQGSGRTRRGPEDYDLDGKIRSAVAIADGGWRRLRSYFSEGFRESIQDWEG